MKIEDLNPYTYGSTPEPKVKAIGWLEGEFEKGECPEGLLEKLKEQEVVNLYKGSHLCEYCDEQIKDGKYVCGTGNGEIRVTGVTGQIYSAPSLITHYIEAHGYKPPDEFIDAVMARISLKTMPDGFDVEKWKYYASKMGVKMIKPEDA